MMRACLAVAVSVAVAVASCGVDGGDRTTVQAVVGPVVSVTVRAPGQLAVSWSTDAAAVRYLVYQSMDSGAFALEATMTGSPPATSYIATGLTGGVSYCYSIVSGYADGSTSAFGATACGSGGAATPSRVQVAGSVFQLNGNASPTEQLWVGQVNTLSIGQTVTAGSVAVQCVGAGGGYFVPCARSREVGGWQCGAAMACGAAATAPLPFPTTFVVGAQNHLDIGIVAAAPTFIVTTAVLAVQ